MVALREPSRQEPADDVADSRGVVEPRQVARPVDPADVRLRHPSGHASPQVDGPDRVVTDDDPRHGPGHVAQPAARATARMNDAAISATTRLRRHAVTATATTTATRS